MYINVYHRQFITNALSAAARPAPGRAVRPRFRFSTMNEAMPIVACVAFVIEPW